MRGIIKMGGPSDALYRVPVRNLDLIERNGEPVGVKIRMPVAAPK